MDYIAGFIGTGNMGGALVEAAAGRHGGKGIAVCDCAAEKTDDLKRRYGVTVTDAAEAAANSRFVIFGVKPAGLPAAIESVREALADNPRGILVSMAAGVSLGELRAMLADEKRPIIRILPNTPVRVGEGVILYAGDGVSKEDKAAFASLFAGAGFLDEIEEGKIDAAGTLSGCGPAFVYLFAEALADGGVECGLTREQAVRYAAKTLAGAGRMIETFGHVGDLKDAVCSPGGTTIAGVHALAKGGFSAAVMDAVLAAYQKTIGLDPKDGR